MGTLTAGVRRRSINSRAYASVPYNRAARMLNQLEVFSEDTPRAALWYIYIIVEQSGPKV